MFGVSLPLTRGRGRGRSPPGQPPRLAVLADGDEGEDALGDLLARLVVLASASRGRAQVSILTVTELSPSRTGAQ
jgi:hypothetical protein